jgi:hypothetical protein
MLLDPPWADVEGLSWSGMKGQAAALGYLGSASVSNSLASTRPLQAVNKH